MRAIILAGGRGTRLRPFTTTLPKPLVPIGDRSILDIVLLQLRKAGVKRVTMAVNHLARLIEAYFGNGERLGMEIDYSLEDKALSTIAPLKLIDDLPEMFFVLNGDVLTDLDFGKLYAMHEENDNDLTVAAFERDTKIDFGVLRLGDGNRVVGFEEKPVYHFNVCMGVNVVSRRVLDLVPAGAPYGFDDLMLDCIREGRKAVSYMHRGLWLDLGRPDDYEAATGMTDELFSSLLRADE